MKHSMQTLILALACLSGPTGLGAAQPAAGDAGETKIAVVFSGGFATDAVDHGRPVILIASALQVPPAVFRDAFSRVKPAQAGEAPEPGQVRLNKVALLNTLAPYGITNERLDEVSDYYRYNGRRGELWRHVRATAYATVRQGVVTGYSITNPGAGYSSAPTVTVAGNPEIHATVTLAFGPDFARNGSIKEIKAGN